MWPLKGEANLFSDLQNTSSLGRKIPRGDDAYASEAVLQLLRRMQLRVDEVLLGQLAEEPSRRSCFFFWATVVFPSVVVRTRRWVVSREIRRRGGYSQQGVTGRGLLAPESTWTCKFG